MTFTVRKKKLPMSQICLQAKSFLWFFKSLTKRQKRKVVLSRVTLLKKLQNLQQRKKNKLFFEELRNRKLLSALYGGLSLRFLKKLKRKVSKSAGHKALSPSMVKNLLVSLETRLDTTLFRMNFFSSFSQARQYIKHGKILVQGRPVRSANFRVEPGQIIALGPKTQLVREKIKENLKKTKFLNSKPNHIEVSYKLFQGVVLFPPQQLYYPTPLKVHNPLSKKMKSLDQKDVLKPVKVLKRGTRLRSKKRALVRFNKTQNPRQRQNLGLRLGLGVVPKKPGPKLRPQRRNNAWKRFFIATRKKSYAFFSPSIALRSC